MSQPKRIIILGTGGNSVDILDTLNDINDASSRRVYECLGFLDDNEDLWGKRLLGVEVLGPLSKACGLQDQDCLFVNGIGAPSNFWKKESIIAKTGVPVDRFETITHPTACVSQTARLGRGVVVFQHAVITSNVVVGDHVIILPNTVISHDDVIGDYTCIAGGVNISGQVTVGRSCYLGTNSTIIGNTEVGDRCLVGMGSCVLRNVPPNSVVVGNPARFLRHTVEGPTEEGTGQMCAERKIPGRSTKGSTNVTRYLITGGAGLIGSHTVDVLVKNGAGEVIVYDNFVRGRLENLAWARSHGSVTIVEGDIRDRKLLEERMEGVDVLIHLAAIRITQCAEDPRLALEVLADGTFNVLDAARKTGVRRVVAASSASVYGNAEEFPTDEWHHPYNNRTIYGAAKLFNEGLLRSFHEMYGLDYIALRFFNCYGPRMDTHGAYTEVLIRWMERINQGLPPIILGDGSQTMDFVCAEDVARANVLAAHSSITDQCFNIGTGVETSLRDLAHALLRVMGSELQPEYGPARKVNPVPRRLADVSLAKRFLDFEALVPIDQGLSRLVDWWQKELRRP